MSIGEYIEETCPECEGSGKIADDFDLDEYGNMVPSTAYVCDRCAGKGLVNVMIATEPMWYEEAI